VSYYRRYRREHYALRKVRRELLARLYSWCGGESVNLCLERLLDHATTAAATASVCGVLVEVVLDALRATPTVRPLLLELLTNAGARLAERDLLRRGLVPRLVVELSRGLLALEGRDVVLSPVLRRLLDGLGCTDALVRALSSVQ
jgi:phosphatidylserine/phosphatidylglycerophosphate/cardiolipin synthase-like enzyme